MQTKTIQYTDGLHPRSRAAWLLFIPADGSAVIPFKGASVPKVAAASVAGRKQNGKWSSVTYAITLAPGVRTIEGVDGWETGTFTEGLLTARTHVHNGAMPTTWTAVADLLGVTVEVAQAFLRSWRPKGAARIDAAEAETAALLG